jgi:hypothetical protein
VKKLLISMLILASCSVVNRQSHSEHPHFFACNKWIDHNKDGIYDAFEFENIKDTFHSSEEVLFVGFFAHLPAGSNLRFRLFSPDGSLIHDNSQIQLFEGTLLHYEFSVGELITQASTGVWVALWDVEDEAVAETDVSFIK